MFIREPFAARFKSNNFDFIYIICHSIFGETEKNRIIEASSYEKVYSYYSNLLPEEDDIIIAGDFNLPANDLAFQSLLNNNNLSYVIDPYWFKTTLSDKGLSSSYDNIFINKEKLLEYTGRYGVYNYTKKNYKVLRKWVSDHLPVFIEASNSLDLD
jgi:exonuclease III